MATKAGLRKHKHHLETLAKEVSNMKEIMY